MAMGTWSVSQCNALCCRVVPPARPIAGLQEDARRGLLRRPRSLPPKYFYDERGSRLFDAICDTPEYYPTRTEDALLARHAAAIVAQARPEHILELGSGTSRKTRHLLAACEGGRAAPVYWPFDVCEEMLLAAGAELAGHYEWLTVKPLLGDYCAGLRHLPCPPGRRLFVFLGGTIGNFGRDEAVSLLQELRAIMAPGDWLLLGADRVKDPAILHAAYNDAQGITAEFNRNLLHVLNRELEANFEVEAFRHEAVYNSLHARIEMYLVSARPQTVRLRALGECIGLAQGERILTEISCKFTPGAIESLLSSARLRLDTHYQPPDESFSLVLASPC